MPLDDVRALTFDVFGTVVDWRSSVIRQCRELGARHDIAAAERGVERESQLAVEQLGADAKVAGRPRQQIFLEPGLVFGQGIPGDLDSSLQPLARVRSQRVHFRNDHVLDDRYDSEVLGDGGFSMNLGHPLGHQ